MTRWYQRAGWCAVFSFFVPGLAHLINRYEATVYERRTGLWLFLAWLLSGVIASALVWLLGLVWPVSFIVSCWAAYKGWQLGSRITDDALIKFMRRDVARGITC